MKTNIRIAVVEDVARVRRQIVETLNARPDWDVVAECANADAALREIPAAHPDVVLLDIQLSGTSGLDLIAPLKRSVRHVRVVMLTVVESSREIACAIGLGAQGYLVKQDAPDLVAGVEDILAGRTPLMSATVAQQVWALLKDLHLGAVQRNSGLTPREIQVLDLTARGLQRGEIAAALGISENTVKHHFGNIFEKLGVHSVKEALIKLRGGRGLLD